jgi:hypothetical protein
MPGLVPGIHDFLVGSSGGKTWMAGTSPATTREMEMSGYIALMHKDEGTSYGVSFPDVPGCISAGDTFEEAVSNAAEALWPAPGLDDTRLS